MNSPLQKRVRGYIDGFQSSDTGCWVRAHGMNAPAYYFLRADNPAIRRDATAGTLVEFTLAQDGRGRPIAVNVTPYTNQPSVAR